MHKHAAILAPLWGLAAESGRGCKMKKTKVLSKRVNNLVCEC